MKTINVILIKKTALTVSFQADSYQHAARRIIEAYDESIYQAEHYGMSPIVKGFMSEGEELEEIKFMEMREDLIKGRITD